MRIKKEALTLIVGWGVALSAGVMGEARADSTSHVSPYRTPDNITPDDLPPIGYRYANLGGHEQRSLRQSFKLPMEALAIANSTSDLLSAVIVQPLPDPHQPFLPVSSTDSAGDPFAGDGAEEAASAHNALGALGRLFAKEEALRGNDASASTSEEYLPSSVTSSVATASAPPEESEDPFADPTAEVSSETTDPFAPEESGSFDDDPFGDF